MEKPTAAQLQALRSQLTEEQEEQLQEVIDLINDANSLLQTIREDLNEDAILEDACMETYDLTVTLTTVLASK